MFYLSIYLISFITSTIFMFMKHPLAMGLMLLIQTLMVCLLSGLMMKTFWFSYILFLVFMGGMLVLFIYVTSLASNEMFSFSMKIFMNSMMTFLFIVMVFMMNDKYLIFSFFMNNEMASLIESKIYISENSLMLNKIYNFPINLISIILMIYLFLTLIAVVKITNIFEGPLRPKTL